QSAHQEPAAAPAGHGSEASGERIAGETLPGAQRAQREESQRQPLRLDRLKYGRLFRPDDSSALVNQSHQQVEILAGHQSMTRIEGFVFCSHAIPAHERITESHAVQWYVG